MSVGQFEDIVIDCIVWIRTWHLLTWQAWISLSVVGGRFWLKDWHFAYTWIFLQLFWFQAGQRRFILHHPSQRGMTIIKMKTCLKRSVRSYDSFPTIPSSTVHWIWLHLRMSVHLGPIHRSHTASEQETSWENWALNCWFMNMATTSHYQAELRFFCEIFHSSSTTQPYGKRTFEIANNH